MEKKLIKLKELDKAYHHFKDLYCKIIEDGKIIREEIETIFEHMENGEDSIPLPLLQMKCHKQAVEKGFWGKDGKKKRNLGELIALIHSELGEALEALRKGNRQNEANWNKDSFEVELADAVIRILDLAESERIDLEKEILAKLAYNEDRPYKHNKNF
jgi:NTP pyrophosphatase (non-canonical NTP hydrolase)